MPSRGVSFTGAGAAVVDLAKALTLRDAASLGRPVMSRGLTMDDNYEHERKMTWSELFFDLIFVTGVRLLGDLLRVGLVEGHEEGNHTDTGFALKEEEEPSVSIPQYLILFFALWALWIDQTDYGTRWGANSVWNFLHFGVYMVGVISYVVSLNHLSEGWGRASLYASAALCYVVDAISKLRILLFFCDNWRVRQYAITDIIWRAITLGLCLAGAVLSQGQGEEEEVGRMLSSEGGEGEVRPSWIAPLAVIAALPYIRVITLIIMNYYLPCTAGKYYGWLPFHIEHYR